MSSRVLRGCFIAGTDTGVGKTVVTAALSAALQRRGLRPVPLKPVETGAVADRVSDAQRIGIAVSAAPPPLYALPLPAAPLAAARDAGIAIDLDAITRYVHLAAEPDHLVLVEGVGGVLVPLTDQHHVADLILQLALPVLIVGRAGLGGINHALLTLEALHRRGAPVLGVLLNAGSQPAADGNARAQQATTIALLQEGSSVPIFGPLPERVDLEQSWREGIERLASEPAIEEVVAVLQRRWHP